MSAEENKALVRKIVNELNNLKGDVSRIRPIFQKYYLPDYIHPDHKSLSQKHQETFYA
jgi:hypothetical protein